MKNAGMFFCVVLEFAFATFVIRFVFLLVGNQFLLFDGSSAIISNRYRDTSSRACP